MGRKIGLAAGVLAAAFVAIQLIPVWLFETNPPVTAEPAWDSATTQALAERACYDCHSNQTVWPWYSRVAPVSWLVTLDVLRARNHLNFSEWSAAGSERSLREVARQIERGEMPPANYVLLHPSAALTAAEQQALITGLQNSLK